MRKFTLIEVVIALTLLVGGVLAAAQMMSMGGNRCARSETEWNEQHMLSQAAEYFLLVEPRADLPERFFPFPDYTARADYRLADQLPPEVKNERGEWQLAVMTVTLNYRGREVKSLEMNRIVRKKEL